MTAESQIKSDLAAAYDRMAHLRDMDRFEEWKRTERRRFAAQMMKEGKTNLLEIGSGTGRDGVWFQENGLEVTAIDLSPKMIEVCRRKGLKAKVMDFSAPDLPEDHFDAIYSLNAMLHVGSEDFESTLSTLKGLLKANGLMYLGQYGGSNFEGILEKDNYRPKRFFNFPDEARLKAFIEPVLTIERFTTIPLPGKDYVFYGATLRK